MKQKPYRHSPVLAAKVRTEIDKLLLAGILRRSYSNWASPLVVVAKSDGRIRLTCNYKKNNEQSIIPVLPLPVVDDLISELGNSRVFSTTDLISGFFQCAIDKDSIPLTAECTQDGLWEWTVMPQGLASSPGWFQSIMLRVCEDLERMKLFIDDIVCFSKNGKQHVCDLRRFLERLTKFDVKLAPNKALLGAAEIIFLGHKISSEGVGSDPNKVRAMKEMPMPQNVSQLRSLLGALSYYRRQLPKMAARTRPLNSLLRKGVKFEFTPHHERIVREMLDGLSSPNGLAFPDFEAVVSGSRKFRLVTDVSADGLGVVIEQQQPDVSIRPLRYLSRTTLDNERKWNISELECAAIVWAIKRNRQMFYGIPFEVETDHQPLQNLASLSDKSNRVQRWFDFLNAYTFKLKHRSKNANANADVLSRLPLPATAEDIQPRYRLTDPSDLDVYFVGASGIHPSRLRTSSDSSLGGLTTPSGGLANA